MRFVSSSGRGLLFSSRSLNIVHHAFPSICLGPWHHCQLYTQGCITHTRMVKQIFSYLALYFPISYFFVENHAEVEVEVDLKKF